MLGSSISDFSTWSPICQRTLNPFNIRTGKSNWLGQHGSYKGFVRFDTFELGVRAGMKLIANYIRRGQKSVKTIITRYAPPTENRTSDYIGYVTAAFDRFGLSTSHIEIGSDQYFRLLRCICIYETRVEIPLDYFYYVFDKWEI